MDWDAKFKSIVKETEQHLSRVNTLLKPASSVWISSATSPRVQHKLVSAGPPTNGHSVRHSDISFVCSPVNKEGHLKSFNTNWQHYADSGRGDLERQAVNFKHESSHTAEGVSGGGRTTAVSLLGARLVDQHREIASLTQSVVGLATSIDSQNTEIRTLRSQVDTLQTKVRCNHDDTLETRFQQFKQEVSRELGDLKGRCASIHERSIASVASQSAQSKAHELRASKYLRGEIKSLKEDISSLKSMFAAQESKFSLWVFKIRKVEKNQQDINEVLSKLLVQQEANKRAGATCTSRSHNYATQLQKMRQLTLDVQSKLDLLEKGSLPDHNSSSTHPHHLATPTPRQCLDSLSELDTSLSTSVSHRQSGQLDTLSVDSIGSDWTVSISDSYINPFVSSNSKFKGRRSRDELSLSEDEGTIDGVSVPSLGSVLSLGSDQPALSEGLKGSSEEDLSEGRDKSSEDLSGDLQLNFELSASTSLLSVGAL